MPVDHTTILTAGSRNTPLSWTSKHGGTGRYPTGRPVPGGWMRPISGSAAGGATSDLAITAGGQTLDFYLSPKRNVAAAKRFLAKALRSTASAGYPRVINTDKAPSLARAIAELKSEGICPPTVEHRQVKYLNNILEGDHGRLKRILGPKGAFKNLDICISDVERDGSDALLAERSGDDVCLRATEPGRGDRQPGLRDGLRTLSRRDHGEMKLGRSWPLHPTLQQHR
ncbi:transposase [Corynebacterium suranareeae]|uniref:Transposase n=1 Tax=Corynebacterium suranareeae TaxID=2506452 RepID=A0A161JLS9_9CORY|nr:transposase [Corynebacterium suranareeae]